MNQNNTPLYDVLNKYTHEQIYSFHVPGHKDGSAFPGGAEQYFRSLLRLDATEVGDLDDLHAPQGAIGEAHGLLRDLYGSVKSYFLVNGSTLGNLAMVFSVLRPDDLVLVQRNCHKSIFSALKLARVRPVFLASEIDPCSGMAVGPSKETVSAALERYPEAKALLLTHPNYYGIARKDVADVIVTARQKGLIVLVDEAHGAHFILDEPVPPSALTFGADAVVQSAHKTLPAMTMGAYLHINSDQISVTDIETALSIFETSSPSYPIMASLDLARAYLAKVKQDRPLFKNILHRIYAFRENLSQLEGLRIVESIAHFQDPFKLLVTNDVSGFELQEQLISMGLYPEMADPQHVLLTLALDEQAPYERAMTLIKKNWHPNSESISIKQPCIKTVVTMKKRMSGLAVTYSEMEQAESEIIPLDQSTGRIAAGPIIPYPPGVPVLIEGERITDEEIEAVTAWQSAGARFHGFFNNGCLKVYKI
ncbi:aminotransferase class I/II-fold pyridoxal phosphate-dependent enzyme [Camelliibacillus cellulosilyticus]|uniref:Aminotransferase class I/II-fold pyridoxal phosphate-dependent enzyme n=1 Tax=Camelliibacillus cellulosilyticus TaxID=2174486 RepID=A0ABV9GST8_9BACL